MSTDKLIEYIKADTDRRFDEMQVQVTRLEEKIDLLFKFKWQIIGGSAVLSIIVSIAMKTF